MKQKFYVCSHCGNLVSMIRDRGVPLYCCGEAMEEILPGTTEASGEKHVPVYTVDGSMITVSVGSVPHPMTEEHYIEWICLETKEGSQMKKLTPEDRPQAAFALCEGDEVEGVYAFCNLHSLWKQ